MPLTAQTDNTFLQDLGLDDDIAESEGQDGAQKVSIADLFGDSDEE
jgi:hypothetical protein